MAGISIGQQLLDSKKDRQLHEQLLKLSLAPLAVRLETADTLEDMANDIEAFHAAYISKGHPVHEVALLHATGERVFATKRFGGRANDAEYFQATSPIFSPLLDGGKGSLLVSKSGDAYRDAERRSWMLWAAHFLVTVAILLLFLTVAVYFQVIRPVNRLVRGVEKMEKGYWGPVELAQGAWEIRWLAWRFSNMVQEVQSALSHLFEAEQKARNRMPVRDGAAAGASQGRSLEQSATVSSSNDSSVYRRLIAVCEEIEAAAPDDLNALQRARVVWKQEVVQANRFGFRDVKARLEDAALRLMEPDAFSALDKRLAELKEFWREWAEQHRSDLYRLLASESIPCVAIHHRIKHTAGVWLKMESKGLSLDEIHDLFACRIIVPTEADCYAALGAVHQAYKPVISRFKDYIAKPKDNGYRSLHSCVASDDGRVFEVQIRSVAMDRQAERGGAAHWEYKKSESQLDRTSARERWWGKVWRWSRKAATQ